MKPLSDYYNDVALVEELIHTLASEFPSLAQRICLPHPTYEGRQTSALMLSTQPNSGRDVVMIMGGVHANEVGSCEIALNLAIMLLRAHSTQAGLGFGGTVDAAGATVGGTVFTAQQIQDLLGKRDLLIYPLVNPDGRQFFRDKAGETHANWRKNRRPIVEDGVLKGIGVDVNRNFDFVFDLCLFAPGVEPVASTDPSSDNYQGPCAVSETETRNVVWLLDKFPHVGWFVDLHSAGCAFFYPWNHDEVQSSCPELNFRSTRAQREMGMPGPGNYREFVASSDLTRMDQLAKRFACDVLGVRQTPFETRPAYWNSPYPGTSHDYAYSRHLVDSSKSKVLGFVCEWGDLNQYPEWEEMEKVIEEITAGLIGFCVETI
jgi:hypothetical protein